jgi:general secretion pathway protein A
MYLTFFGLNEKPFAITPDPRYLFLSARHAEALAHLLYGINEAGGFVQLTGEVGTGKTTIVRSLLAQTPKNAEIALILNPKMTAPEFLLTICEELGIGVPDSALGSLKDLVDILSLYLLRAHAAGHRVVLVVDEAQNLSPQVLEQVRLLTNLETNTQKLLQIILIGQPELRELLSRNELRQLAQRITGRYHLNPLSREETTAYVRHRLRVAGATTDIFAPGALTAVFRLSAGVPRVINVICDRALLGAYSLDRHRVTGALVRSAAAEVFGRRFTPYWLPWAATVGVAVMLTAVTWAVWNFQPWSAHPRFATAAAADAAAHAGEGSGASHPGDAGAITRTDDEASAAVPSATALPSHRAAVPQLSQLLLQHAAETDTDNAFAKLFGLWGAKYQANGTDPCTQAAQQGLACVAERGSFGQLRLYNHPVILLLNDGAGASHQVVLTALDDEQARLDLGGAHSVRIGELSRYWLGDFVMLWRPAASPVKSLSAGMRGAQVRWLRQSLQRLHGGASGDAPVSDVFDDELVSWVRDFQRKHQLAVDGIAGVQTQIALASAVSGPDAPLLSAADAHHGGG